MRLGSYEFYDDLRGLMVMADYMEESGAVTTHWQFLQWSDDNSQKCVIGSETAEKVSAYYAESISGAIVDIVVFCSMKLSIPLEEDFDT